MALREASMSQESPPKQYKRRPHNKSKTGCSECKRRRIKCDEHKPHCWSCIRRSIQCVYPTRQEKRNCLSPASSAVDVGSTAASPRISINSEQRHESTPPSNALALHRRSSTLLAVDDLPLLHHWILSTSRSISESPSFDAYWQTAFPQIGFRYSFVLHGILSVAALHLASLHASDKKQHVVDAAHHHNIALQGFRKQVTQLSEDNSDALFACASLNVLCVFGMSAQHHGKQESVADPATRRAQILGAEWIPMIRGVEAVLISVYSRIHLGSLSPIFEVGNWDEVGPDIGSLEEDHHMRLVREIWASTGGDEVFDETLHLLRKCCSYVHQFSTTGAHELSVCGPRRVWSGHLFWVHFAPNEYFVRLQQRQPVALVIFAYFGALLHESDGFWFMAGWGRNIVDVVDDLLGEYWAPWMKWPKEVVGLAGTSIDLQRSM